MTSPAPYRAAWVPDDDPERPWDDALALAVPWIDAEARDQGLRSVLITSTFSTLPARLTHYQHGLTHFTPRSDRPGGWGMPVLAYVPHADALELALRLARGSSVCVVESKSNPVVGWASAVGAVDLTLGEVTPSASPEFAELIDRLVFYGNNGYRPEFDHRMARSILEQFMAADLLDPAVIVGHLAAHGISPDGQKRIREMAAKI